MIRLLPRTSDGVADLGLQSLDPWNASESCASILPNESEPCSQLPGGERQIWHFCMLFSSEHQQPHVLMSNPCGAVQTAAPYYFAINSTEGMIYLTNPETGYEKAHRQA